MAKYNGFPGGGNMNNLLKQAQKMQAEMKKHQEELEAKEFTATVGGGAVRVTMSGKRLVTKVEIDKEVIDPEDKEMLEDLIMAAVNEVNKQVDMEMQNGLSGIAGGLGGMF